MQRCNDMNTTEFLVGSSSSTKEYRVRAFLPDDEPPTCDCIAFAISRNRDGGKTNGGKGWCKHIDQVLANNCSWQESISSETQIIDGVCPRCGGATSGSAPIVLPESPSAAADKVAHSLQALMADLEGRQLKDAQHAP